MRMKKNGDSRFLRPFGGDIGFSRRHHHRAPGAMSVGSRTADEGRSRTGLKHGRQAPGPCDSHVAVFVIAWTYLAVLAVWGGVVPFAPIVLAGESESAGFWSHNDYAAAFRQARDEQKLLLIFFDDGSIPCRQFRERTRDQAAATRLAGVVGVRLSLDAAVVAQGQRKLLLDQKGFRSLEHGPGLAIVDLKHREAACYGWVVSVWKFGREESISADDLAALLALPPGNRQEREAAWAARAEQSAERQAENRAEQGADAGRPTAPSRSPPSSQSTAGRNPSNEPPQATADNTRPRGSMPSMAADGQPPAKAHPSLSPAKPSPSPADPTGSPATPRQPDSRLEPSLPPAFEGRESKPQKAVAEISPAEEPVWRTDYSQAVAQAKRDGKMLLIHFVDENDPRSRGLESVALQDADVGRRLQRYELLRLPRDATVPIDDKEVTLLKHEAFSEMLGRPGLAIVDYANRNSPHYETVVSQFPLTETLSYSAQQVAVMLDLPPGTLTQRTLIYAVRTHPERPASADGELLPELQREAERHSSYQARILRQGHHQWETRFHRLNALLPRGLVAREVCAESWPGQNLVEAAIECVRCWRLSSGHWSAVRARQSAFGYDMKRGRNGVWYATGVFGGR